MCFSSFAWLWLIRRIIIARNACIQNVSVASKYTTEIKYICNIFRTCADEQTIRPCFKRRYTHSFWHVCSILPLLDSHNVIEIIYTPGMAIAAAIQLHVANKPIHVNCSVELRSKPRDQIRGKCTSDILLAFLPTKRLFSEALNALELHEYL